MKKIIRMFSSVLCFISLAWPLNVTAAALPEVIDLPNEQDEQAPDADEVSNDYHLVLLAGDFGLRSVSGDISEPLNTLILFIRNPEGKIVRDAQVVATLIGPDGSNQLQRARPSKGGYAIAVNHLLPGKYRVETEIVTDGWLLTDEFAFTRA